MVLLLLLLAGANAVDGVVVLSPLDEPQDVSGVWLARQGDDLAWKEPGLDDSAWLRAKVPLGLGLHTVDGQQPFAGVPGLYWYRLRLVMPPNPPVGLGLEIGAIDTAAEVYVDGQLVGQLGKIPTGPNEAGGVNAHNVLASFPLPDAAVADGEAIVALRVWRSALRASSNPGRGGVTHKPLLVGDLRTLAKHEVLRDLDRVFVGVVFFVVGLYHVHLWRRRRELTSYLWFGLSSAGMSVYMFTGHNTAHLYIADAEMLTKVSFSSLFLSFPCFIQFLWPFLQTPIRWWWRVAQGGNLFFFVVTMAWPNAWFVQRFILWWALLLALPVMIGTTILVVRRALQGDPEAKTVTVGAVAVLLTTINNIGVNENWWRTPEMTNVAFLIFVLSMAASQSNRFARVYGELDQKNAELLRMDKLKDEFLANTSHELRTPLNGILGITEGLIDGAAGPQSEQSIDNLRMILSSGQRLSTLINDILDFSKLREGKVSMQTTPLDIHPAVDVVVRLLRPLAEQKGIQLDNRVPKDLPTVLADEGRLQQILTNLLGNAIKFTDQGGVVVEGGVEGERVWFAVQDTGPGVDAKDHQRIFNAFEQGDGSTARTHGGTGLGLSITRRLVELHGGEIKLASALGKGARFTVYLPQATEQAREKALLQEPEVVRRPVTSTSTISLAELPPPPAPPAAKPADVHDHGRRFHVLVVDDEPINVRVLENHLSVQFDVARAGNGPEALELIAKGFKPDLVLLDVMMPRMSGYEVCQHIRERWTSSEVPVVLVTAKDRVADVVSGFDAGANDYLTKPVAKGELLARIKTHLAVAKLNEATSRFVPFEFLAMLGKDSLMDVERGDQVQKEMSVLFSDIRGFTTIVEKNTPAENIRFINDYLTRMEPPIKDHAGFVDSFVGDAIMALFDGSGDGAEGGAVDAVTAGVAMQKALPGFNELRVKQGLPPVHIGVGVMTGLITCGTIGGKFHIKCGVIGDAVNTASRIEGMTKMYGARFLVGESTKARLPEAKFTLRTADRVMAKGKKTPTTIYEVLDAEEEGVFSSRCASLAKYEEAVAKYQQRAFADAKAILEELVKQDATDRLAALYLERCAAFLLAPPAEDWDGVVKLESK